MNTDERFLQYIAFDTTSNENCETCPSSPNQEKLAAFLEGELKSIGMSDVRKDAHSYVYAKLPATKGCENRTPLGFIAHMDTSDAVPGGPIHPLRVDYQGGDIALSDTVTMKVSDFPYLEDYKGQELIVTDGTTLLGCDDKAGIAEIITAMEYLIQHPEIAHGPISVAFNPDEEIGRGAELFDVEGFGAAYAYTVDGGALGEIEYENFNAASARVTVSGVNIHPGSAKDKMKNAILMAVEFISMLPPAETPAHTEGYEGFYHVGSISGNETQTEFYMILRDHDAGKLEEKKAFLTRLAEYMNNRYGAGTVALNIRDSYRNMKEKILPNMYIVDRAVAAMKDCGVTPVVKPIRGGTDGATLSFMGLPCPNLSTGGENFHGIHEFVSVPAMKKMTEIIIRLATEA